MARRRESGNAITMPRGPAVNARAEPAERRRTKQPAEPGQPRQFTEHGNPAEIADVPGAVRRVHVHFLVEASPRERRPRRNHRVVVVNKAEPVSRVELLDPLLDGPAEWARPIKEDFEFALARHPLRLDDSTLSGMRFFPHAEC